MFQYFGWVNLEHGAYCRLWDEGKITMEAYDKARETLVDNLKNHIASYSSEGYLIKSDTKDQKRVKLSKKIPELEYSILYSGNAQITLHFSGSRNHYHTYPLDIFTWIKNNAPYSYGLLYIRDDEDPDNYNNFIVYSLASNNITKFKDKLLSPCKKILEEGLFSD